MPGSATESGNGTYGSDTLQNLVNIFRTSAPGAQPQRANRRFLEALAILKLKSSTAGIVSSATAQLRIQTVTYNFGALTVGNVAYRIPRIVLVGGSRSKQGEDQVARKRLFAGCTRSCRAASLADRQDRNLGASGWAGDHDPLDCVRAC